MTNSMRDAFNKKIDEVDEMLNTQTYFVSMSLDDLKDFLGLSYDMEDYACKLIVDAVSPTQEDASMTMNEMIVLDQTAAYKAFSLSKLAEYDEFINPICIDIDEKLEHDEYYYQVGKYRMMVHPGRTRMLFASLHKEQIDVVFKCAAGIDHATLIELGIKEPKICHEYTMKHYNLRASPRYKNHVLGFVEFNAAFDASKATNKIIKYENDKIYIDNIELMYKEYTRNWKLKRAPVAKKYEPSRDDFNKQVNEFDAKHNTQTLFGRMTIKELNHKFTQPNYVKWRILQIVNHIFSADEINSEYCKKTFAGDGAANYLVGQLSSLAKLYTEETMLSPIGVSVFSTGETFVHPGQTRMLLEDVHTDDVDVIVTNYGADLFTKSIARIPDAHALSPDEFMKADEYHLRDYATLRTNSIPYGAESMGNVFWELVKTNTPANFKDFVYKDHLGDKMLGDKYINIGTGSQKMTVRFNKNIIYVDALPLLYLANDHPSYPWSFVPK